MELSKETARQILLEAKSGGFFDEEIPDDEEKLNEEAVKFALEAEKVSKEGWARKNETIKAILNIIYHDKKFPMRSSGGFSEQDHRDVPDTNAAFYKGLPIPKEPEGEPVQMPADISRIEDEELRSYHSLFNYYFGRVRWLLAEEKEKLSMATHLRDSEYRKAYKKYSEQLVKQGERPTKDLVDSFARDEVDFVAWDRKVVDHQNNVEKLRALTDIFEGNIERLSREATMRQNEWDRTR